MESLPPHVVLATWCQILRHDVILETRVVPGVGIEPTRCCHRGILSPVRLPVPPSRQGCLNTRMEAAPGFEPGYEGFADPCLTTWLCRLWSGRRDLNPRHSAWEADALPLSYSRTIRTCVFYTARRLLSSLAKALWVFCSQTRESGRCLDRMSVHRTGMPAQICQRLRKRALHCGFETAE